jgi:PleD family two-component response regulator
MPAPLHSFGGGGRFEPDTDPVTGLRAAAAFRRDLQAALAGARRTGRPVALALLQADIGYGEGADRRARRLAAALRRTGGFGYRLGRADYALLVPGTVAHEVTHMLDRLAAGLALGGGRPDPPVVAGVAVSRGAHAPEDLVAAAATVLRRTRPTAA